MLSTVGIPRHQAGEDVKRPDSLLSDVSARQVLKSSLRFAMPHFVESGSCR
jgi:hypothetical protein